MLAEARPWLVAAGASSAIAALLHLAIIAGGAAWYRFFGAGERYARAVERGQTWPHLVTLGIAGVLGVWAAYALSGAGVLPRLPWRAAALVLISAIYLLRGMAFVPAVFLMRGRVDAFAAWSSLICLGIGVLHAVGVLKAWPAL